jgi:peptide/nickel transport system ATP-binding protein
MSGLKVENLSLSISGVPILQDVDMALAPGKVLGVVGESGSGKSLTAMSITGLLPVGSARAGRVTLDDQVLSDLSEAALCRVRGAQVGMIFQEPMTALNPVKTIGAQVAETLIIHGAASRREARLIAGDTLRRVGLDPEQVSPDRFPHELSGGQRQRVCIALAIALKPTLLIADEPTTALDVTTQAQILELLKQLVDEDGMALMLITHDLAVVAGMADDVVVMRNGVVVEAGPTRLVLTAQSEEYTRSLIRASTHQPKRKPMAQQIPLLEVKDVVRDYPGARRGLFGRSDPFRAVDQVSFTLRKGESLGLVGESGCGKSTLTRALLGLEPVQGGSITLEGGAVGIDMPNDLRLRMQVVFQDPYGSFNPRHRVGRLISEPFHLSPPTGDRVVMVADALEAVGLQASDAQKFPHEFSGGQRQRIAIARALITQPDIIVLDEAVSALDVSVRAQILDLLASLQNEFSLSYLFISHDLTVVQAITDRVMVMKSGRIVEAGATEDVFRAPRHPYTRNLLKAAPKLAVA